MEQTLNLYVLTQSDERGYDTYDSCVVVARNADEAREVHPSPYVDLGERWWSPPPRRDDWAHHPDRVTATLIGTAAEGLKAGQVLCSSFDAG